MGQVRLGIDNPGVATMLYPPAPHGYLCNLRQELLPPACFVPLQAV